jgi:predicted GTPase
MVLTALFSADTSRRSFFREFLKVVKASDVILEVLDARDPLGTRCPSVEQQILSMDPNKKIVLVLNKIGSLVCLFALFFVGFSFLFKKHRVLIWYF